MNKMNRMKLESMILEEISKTTDGLSLKELTAIAYDSSIAFVEHDVRCWTNIICTRLINVGILKKKGDRYLCMN